MTPSRRLRSQGFRNQGFRKPGLRRLSLRKRRSRLERLETRRLLAGDFLVADYRFDTHGIGGNDDLSSVDTHDESVASPITSPWMLSSTAAGDPPRALSLAAAFDETTAAVPADGIGQYFEFTVTPDNNRPLTLLDIEWVNARAAADSKAHFALYFDDVPGTGGDNFNTPLVSGQIDSFGRFESQRFAMEGKAAFANLRLAVTFRYYVWGDAGSTGDQWVDSIRVRGIEGELNTTVFAYRDDAGQLIQPLGPRGDRLPDFSAAGYRGGQPIPEVAATIDASRIVDVAAVVGDNTASIQAAIDQVSAMTPDGTGYRGVVRLAAGEYDIADQLRILHSGVVLSGAGDGDDPSVDTILNATGTDRRVLIEVGADSGFPSGQGGTRSVVDDYVPVGATSFEVDDVADFSVGDAVLVRRPSTAEWISDIGMDRIPPKSNTIQWAAGEYDQDYERVITGIEGNRIQINAPLMMALDQRYGGGRVFKYTFDRIEEVGIEGIRGVSEFASDVDEDHSWTFIRLNAVRDAWVRDVTGKHFAYATVWASGRSLRATVENASSLEPKSQITGGRRYAFTTDGQFILMRDLYSEQSRHDFVNNARQRNRGPNVFLDGQAVSSNSTTGPHQRFSTGTLYDTIRTNREIEARNRGNNGSGHGWGGANMVFWNTQARRHIVQNPPTAQNWLIGGRGTILDEDRYGLHPPATIDALGSPIEFDDPDNPTDSLYVAQRNWADANANARSRELVMGDYDLGVHEPGSDDDRVFVDADWDAAVTTAFSGTPPAEFDESIGPQWSAWSFDVDLASGQLVKNAVLTLGLRAVDATNSTLDDTVLFDDVNDARTIQQLGRITELPVGETAPLTIVLNADDLIKLQDGLFNLAIGNHSIVDWAHLDLRIQDGNAGTGVTLSTDTNSIIESGGVVTATATLDQPAAEAVTLDLILGGDAVIERDYVVDAMQVVIPPGGSSATFTITAVDNVIDNVDRTVALSVVGDGLASNPTTVSLINDDTSVALVTASPNEISENGGVSQIDLVLSHPLDRDVTFDITAGGDAVANVDYVATPSTVTVPAGTTAAAIELVAIDDSVFQGDREVSLEFSGPGFGAISTGVRIVDDERDNFTVVATPEVIVEGDRSVLRLQAVAQSNRDRNFVLTFGGDATVDVDYRLASTTVTLPAGQTITTFDLESIDNGVVDGSRTATLTATVQDGSASDNVTVRIDDNDTSFATASATPIEISEAGGVSAIGLRLSRPLSRDVTFDVNVGGDAIAGVDYVALPGTVTLPAGTTEATLQLTAIDNAIVQDDRGVVVEFTEATFTSTAANVQIVDDDDPTLTLVATPDVISEDGERAAIELRSDLAFSNNRVFRIETGGDATPQLDYRLSSDTVTLLAGETVVTVNLEAIDNDIIDGSRTVVMTATSDGLPASGASVRIDDDDTSTLVLGLSDQVISENGGTSTVVLELSKAFATSQTFELSIAGDATMDRDYRISDTRVTLAAGQRRAEVVVTAIDNSIVDADRTVTLRWNGAGLQSNPGQIEIVNDDVSTLEIGVERNAINESGGTVDIELTVSKAFDRDTQYVVSATGTAVLGTDFTLDTAVVTLSAGQTSGTVRMAAIDNDLVDGDRLATITINGVQTGDAATTITIVDDDEAVLSLVPSNDQLFENGDPVVVTAMLSNPRLIDTIVDVAAGSDAVEGVDYDRSTDRVVIPAGTRSADFVVSPIDNDVVDTDRSINLTATATGLESVSTSIELLNDDEAAMTFAASSVSIVEGDAAALTVSLTRPFVIDLEFALLSEGSADLGDDFVLAEPVITIPAGETSASIDVAALDNLVVDGRRIAKLRLRHPFFDDRLLEIAIDDNDVSDLSLNVNRDAVSERDGEAVITAEFSLPSNEDRRVSFAFGGDAIVNDDFVVDRYTVEVPAGATTAAVLITSIDNGIVDGNRIVEVVAHSGGVSRSTEIEILDDDVATLRLAPDDAILPEDVGVVRVQAIFDRPFVNEQVVTLAFAGNAFTGLDYQIETNQIVIPAGKRSGSLNVEVLDDDIVDGDRSLIITATSDQTNASEASWLILDNDAASLELTLDRSFIFENDETVQATLTLDKPFADDQTFDLRFDGSAIPGEDFSVDSGPITIAAGQTTATAVIRSLDNTIVDADRVITVAAFNDVLESNLQSVTISNDDVSQLSVTLDNPSLDERDGVAVANVRLSNAFDRDVEVRISIGGDAADDVRLEDAVVFVPAGQTSATTRVSTIDNDVVDGTRTGELRLESDATSNAAVAFEVSDDDVSDVSIDSTTIVLDEDGESATVEVRLSKPLSETASFTIDSVGTAVLGADFELSFDDTAALIVDLGETTVQFQVRPIDDSIVQGDRRIELRASSSRFESVTTSIDLVDDDQSTASIDPSADAFVESEFAEVTVRFSHAFANSQTYQLRLGGDAAIQSGLDGQTIAVELLAGQTEVVVAIDGFNNDRVDFDRTLALDLLDSADAVIASGELTVLDDDVVKLRIAPLDPVIAENTGVTAVELSLDKIVTRDVVVDLRFSGSALAGRDYEGVVDQFIIPAQSQTARFELVGVDNNTVDAERVILVDATSMIAGTANTSLMLADDEQSTLTVSLDRERISESNETAVLSIINDVAFAFDTQHAIESNGDLVLDEDFTLSDTVVILPAGQRSVDVQLSSIDNAIYTADRPLNLTVRRLFDEAIAQASLLLADDDVGSLIVQASNDPMTVIEGEDGPTIAVSLSTAPLSDVTVVAMVRNTESVLLDRSQFTFTPDNWATSQVVRVSTNLDLLNQPELPFEVEFTVAGEAERGFATSDAVTIAGNRVNVDPGVLTLRELPTNSVALQTTIDGTPVEPSRQDAASIELDLRSFTTDLTVEPITQSEQRIRIIADDDTVTFGDGWTLTTPTYDGQTFAHQLVSNSATVALQNDRPFTNPLDSHDIDGNGTVEVLDVLAGINAIRRRGSVSDATRLNINDPGAWRGADHTYVDVNRDGQLKVDDVLSVINRLRRDFSTGEAERVVYRETTDDRALTQWLDEEDERKW